MSYVRSGLPSVGKRFHLQCRRPRLDSWVRRILWRRDRLPTPVFLGFPGGSADKESACNEGIPGLGRSPGEGILYGAYIMRNSGLDEAHAGIKIAGRNINNLRYADYSTLMAGSEELESLLMRVKKES